jgi:feruloyl esterase
MLIFSGWSDPLVSPLATLGYYEKAVEFDKTVVNDLRLFMMPGAAHSLGGDGPSVVNFLDIVDQWLETDQAPDQTPAFWMDGKTMQLDGSRLICAYPKVAKYDGKGNPRDASSFSCAERD